MVPPGVVPNYVNPPSIGYEIVVSSTVTGACALIAVSARLVSKLFITKSIGWDDYFSVLAMVFAIGRNVGGCMMLSYGTGRHIWDEPISRALVTSRYSNAINALYLWSIMFAKLSILALYIGIFGVNRTFKRLSWTLGGTIIFYCVACTPMYILECIPGGARSFAQTKANQCVPVIDLNVAIGAINIATDTALLLLPIPMIMRLQMSKGKSFAILVLFVTGLVAWAASVVREILFLQSAHHDTDATRSQVPHVMWLTIEMNVGILAGCLPVLFPLIQRVGQSEGLRFYMSSLASNSKLLRKKLSRGKLHSDSKSEPRGSESLKDINARSVRRPSDEEKILPSVVDEEPWFMQEQAKRDTPRALNEGY